MSFSPINKGLIHGDVAYPVANVDFFAADISPTNFPTTFILQAAMTSAGNLYAVVTNGGVQVGMDFNKGAALVANALYVFKLLVHSGDSVNFRYTAIGNIRFFRVQEVETSDSFIS